MITIALIEDGSRMVPERELSNQEKKSVTSIVCNGEAVIYYQGDEPQNEE